MPGAALYRCRRAGGSARPPLLRLRETVAPLQDIGQVVDHQDDAIPRLFRDAVKAIASKPFAENTIIFPAERTVRPCHLHRLSTTGDQGVSDEKPVAPAFALAFA